MAPVLVCRNSRLGGLNNPHLFSPSSGGQKSQTHVLADPVLSEGPPADLSGATFSICPHMAFSFGGREMEKEPLGPTLLNSFGGISGKELACQCRRPKRCRFHPWARKIPWRRAWQPSQHLAWKIPWTEEPGWLQFIRSQRVGHD